MSKEEKLNRKAKAVVLTPMAILIAVCLLLGSCAGNKCIYKKNYKKSNESRYSFCG
jgi:hypothetical protein